TMQYNWLKVLEPDVFTCVPGKLFYDKDYTTFLYLVNSSGLLSKLTNPDQKVTLFACSNEQIYQYGIRYNKDNDMIEQYLDGQWQSMRTADLMMFIQDHIHYGVVTDLSGEGYLQMSSMNYVHYKDNKVEGARNIKDKKPSTVQEKNVNERNGILYTMDEPLLSNYAMGDYIYNTPDFSDFAALMVKAGLLDPEYIDPATNTVVPNVKFISAGSWTAFIPTNAAMAAALRDGIVSDEMKTPELRKFIHYHFIRTATIFDDGKQSGDFQTARVESTSTQGTVYSNLTVNNTPGNLQVTDHSGRTTTISHQNANVLVQRGVVHKINNVLKY
ncbi:MAG TPA: fasciclin domain-containing protein, partial [Prolixibacteraceae bacterium]|nr:fasciclin domain-containing protein [Prolixibacteraceae bacterium]